MTDWPAVVNGFVCCLKRSDEKKKVKENRREKKKHFQSLPSSDYNLAHLTKWIFLWAASSDISAAAAYMHGNQILMWDLW